MALSSGNVDGYLLVVAEMSATGAGFTDGVYGAATL
jgi:hypothetical protein